MVFGTTHTRRRKRTFVAILALVWLALPSAVWAVECTAVDRYDLPRDCTALEELGECMATARESVHQCLENNTRSIWGWYRCQEDGFIDMAACVLLSPFRMLLK